MIFLLNIHGLDDAEDCKHVVSCEQALLYGEGVNSKLLFMLSKN